MRLAAACLLAGACGRVGFDASREILVDAPSDADRDAIDAGVRPGCADGETPGPFTSDFEQGVPGWGSLFDMPPAEIEVSLGSLHVRPAANAGGSRYAGLEGLVADFRERRAFVEVPQMVNLAGCAQVSLVIIDDDTVDTFAELVQNCGNLDALLFSAGSITTLASTPYEAAAHRWWQLRATGGTLSYEVSPDGVTWSQLASTPTPTYFDDAYLELSGGTFQLETEPPGEARFDHATDCLGP